MEFVPCFRLNEIRWNNTVEMYQRIRISELKTSLSKLQDAQILTSAKLRETEEYSTDLAVLLDDNEKRLIQVLGENTKIIQINSQLRGENEKSKQGLQDMVTLYKKEKRSREKLEKTNDELKKLNTQLMGQIKAPTQSPFKSPLKRESFAEINNKL